MFCVGILPAIRGQRGRTVERDWTPGVAYIDDIAISPAEITSAAMEDFKASRTDLVEVGITLAPGKTLALPFDGHRVTSEELQLLADAGVSMAPSDGLVVVGVPVGLDALVEDHMRRAPDQLGLTIVVCPLAAMNDKQAATLIAGMYLARRTGYLERNVDSRLGKEA